MQVRKETGDPREKPADQRHRPSRFPHAYKCGSDPDGNRTMFAHAKAPPLCPPPPNQSRPRRHRGTRQDSECVTELKQKATVIFGQRSCEAYQQRPTVFVASFPLYTTVYSKMSTAVPLQSRQDIQYGAAVQKNLSGTWAGETGDPRENPPTSGIVRYDSQLRKSRVDRTGIEPGSTWWEASSLTAQPPWPKVIYTLAIALGRTRTLLPSDTRHQDTRVHSVNDERRSNRTRETNVYLFAIYYGTELQRWESYLFREFYLQMSAIMASLARCFGMLPGRPSAAGNLLASMAGDTAVLNQKIGHAHFKGTACVDTTRPYFTQRLLRTLQFSARASAWKVASRSVAQLAPYVFDCKSRRQNAFYARSVVETAGPRGGSVRGGEGDQLFRSYGQNVPRPDLVCARFAGANNLNYDRNEFYKTATFINVNQNMNVFTKVNLVAMEFKDRRYSHDKVLANLCKLSGSQLNSVNRSWRAHEVSSEYFVCPKKKKRSFQRVSCLGMQFLKLMSSPESPSVAAAARGPIRLLLTRRSIWVPVIVDVGGDQLQVNWVTGSREIILRLSAKRIYAHHIRILQDGPELLQSSVWRCPRIRRRLRLLYVAMLQSISYFWGGGGAMRSTYIVCGSGSRGSVDRISLAPRSVAISHLDKLSLYEAEEHPGSRTLAGLQKRVKYPQHDENTVQRLAGKREMRQYTRVSVSPLSLSFSYASNVRKRSWQAAERLTAGTQAVLYTLEPHKFVHWLLPQRVASVLHTWQYGTRYLFPCKSAIGSEPYRAYLTNCDPIAKSTSVYTCLTSILS
ncbi:hypothetical protein PR048_001472 [Dryococelus australis]|uniref:Uncharacterized protein n=1 Tax=Dryococelus australis TaxID=614101 RepID=A0ABQ9IHK7_9NEOP|nr:hypothetical protein PR048_001472 [Dryococelus australis]